MNVWMCGLYQIIPDWYSMIFLQHGLLRVWILDSGTAVSFYTALAFFLRAR